MTELKPGMIVRVRGSPSTGRWKVVALAPDADVWQAGFAADGKVAGNFASARIPRTDEDVFEICPPDDPHVPSEWKQPVTLEGMILAARAFAAAGGSFVFVCSDDDRRHFSIGKQLADVIRQGWVPRISSQPTIIVPFYDRLFVDPAIDPNDPRLEQFRKFLKPERRMDDQVQVFERPGPPISKELLDVCRERGKELAAEFLEAMKKRRACFANCLGPYGKVPCALSSGHPLPHRDTVERKAGSMEWSEPHRINVVAEVPKAALDASTLTTTEPYPFARYSDPVAAMTEDGQPVRVRVITEHPMLAGTVALPPMAAYPESEIPAYPESEIPDVCRCGCGRTRAETIGRMTCSPPVPILDRLRTLRDIIGKAIEHAEAAEAFEVQSEWQSAEKAWNASRKEAGQFAREGTIAREALHGRMTKAGAEWAWQTTNQTLPASAPDTSMDADDAMLADV
jgi:hypothetical protein